MTLRWKAPTRKSRGLSFIISGGAFMLYSTLYDFTVAHQDINVTVERALDNQQILMRAEVVDDPTFYAEVILPELKVMKSAGFTEDDIVEVRVFLLRNESLIREMAAEVAD